MSSTPCTYTVALTGPITSLPTWAVTQLVYAPTVLVTVAV